ncbi:MAG: 16S rRNA (cytidine(1402)-2'-O)-methyltransferase [Bacilli bacterium]
MIQKSYNDTPSLYLIPTPIGNLEDITIRSIKILNEVSVIFSEDTRVTINLLNHYEIKKKLLSLNKDNEYKMKHKVIKELNKGNSVAIVTDRGTPLISDPGNIVSLEAINNGFNVISLPGATAFVPALTSSGIDNFHFLFYGFLDSKKTAMKKELESLKTLPYTIIFYEAPHRIIKTLEIIKDIFGNRKISISREISKKFEEILRGDIETVIKEFTTIKGEMVIVIEGNNKSANFDNLTIIEHVNLYIKEGLSKNDSFKKVAKDRKLSKSEIYNDYHQ